LRSASNQRGRQPSLQGDSRHHRPGGFTASEIDELTGISRRLAIPADMFAQRAVGENVLKACINIGPAARLDFIVIGPAVNLVSPVRARGEGSRFIYSGQRGSRSRLCRQSPLARHELRELTGSHEHFAPELPPA
jgi:hypothetical protein